MKEDSFYSIDKLVEFGMGISVANQMIATMNHGINKMDVAGAGKIVSSCMGTVYYVVIDEKQTGPYSLAELSRLIAEKKVLRETYVWKPGMKHWDLAENIEEVLQLVALVPPPLPKG